ncbi:MAG TPA: hypothetical protein VMT56_00480 [Candidatus Bathyarchaeia archaeon]|nr:hypothetical protein [Candidatus Bathyarchaeia archaeon]
MSATKWTPASILRDNPAAKDRRGDWILFWTTLEGRNHYVVRHVERTTEGDAFSRLSDARAYLCEQARETP